MAFPVVVHLPISSLQAGKAYVIMISGVFWSQSFQLDRREAQTAVSMEEGCSSAGWHFVQLSSTAKITITQTCVFLEAVILKEKSCFCWVNICSIRTACAWPEEGCQTEIYPLRFSASHRPSSMLSIVSVLEVVLFAFHMWLIGRVYFVLQFEGFQSCSREGMVVGVGTAGHGQERGRMLEFILLACSFQLRTPGPSTEKGHPWDSESVFSLWLNLSGNILCTPRGMSSWCFWVQLSWQWRVTLLDIKITPLFPLLPLLLSVFLC